MTFEANPRASQTSKIVPFYCGTLSAQSPSAKSIKPYANISGSANNKGYNVQVGAGVKTNIGSVGVIGNANGNWHGRPNTSIKGDFKF